MNTLIDGESTSSIPADDRALLFGESVFETIAFHNDRAPLWAGHMARLTRSAAALGWEMPSEDLLASECARLISAVAEPKLIIRITLTGGSGGSGYWPPPVPKIRRIVQLRSWPKRIEQHQAEGLRCIVSRFQLPLPWAYSGLKHGSRFLQTRAAMECRSRGADEALLLNAQDCFAEALSSNLVLVVDNQLLSPSGVEVEGVGLAWLKTVLGDKIQSGTLPLKDVAALDEMLVINSVGGIRPVTLIEDNPLPCGRITRKLQSIWRKELLLCD